MPSGLRETKKPQFEIYYEAPWGGVASDKSPVDIAANQFVKCDGLSIRNGILCYSNIASQNSKWDLELITPTNIPANNPGTGGYVTLTDVDINLDFPNVPTDPDHPGPPKFYNVRIYTVPDSSTFNIGESFVVSGCDNPKFNITDTVAAIPDATHITTGTKFFGPDYTFTVAPSVYYYSNGGTPGPPTPQNWPNAYICLIFNCGNYLCAVDQYGFAYIATLQTDGTIKFQLDQTAPTGPAINFGVPNAVKVVNGVAYISVRSTNTLFSYTPTVNYIIASQFTAGLYIDIFDEYMLQLNTNTAALSTGGDPLGDQPCAINWSGPDEFGVWDPSINRIAGYQVLTSVEDYISGFVAVDNVGYIFKREGVTQITATGVAIQPFNFTTYWNSTAGQGLIFPGTLKQYGRFVFLGTDSAIYMFYGGSFTDISEPATQAIYSSFNVNPPLNAISNSVISAGFAIYPFNDDIPISEYIFAAATTDSTGVGTSIVFWFYHMKEKTWTSITKSILNLLSMYVAGATAITVNSIKTATVFLNTYYPAVPTLNVTNLPTNIFYINFSYTIGENNFQQTFVYYNLVSTTTADITSITPPPGVVNLVLRQEEIKLGRKPTIRRVLIKACGTGTLSVFISGKSFGVIVLDGTQVQKTYYTPSGIFTGEDPQLSVTSTNFIGQITKMMLSGAYADGDVD